MSFLKKLFGGGAKPDEGPKEERGAAVEHEGFTIIPTPYKEGGQYQLCGIIEKEIDGEMKRHRFVRADRMASLEDVTAMTIQKARQIIDQQGERALG